MKKNKKALLEIIYELQDYVPPTVRTKLEKLPLDEKAMAYTFDITKRYRATLRYLRKFST